VSSDGKDPKIFLCCAEEDESGLAAVVAALREHELSCQPVPGVELDAGAFGEVLDKHAGLGLYVLCRSDYLDRFQVRKLEGLFSARRGPGHRLLVVSLDPSELLAVVGPIMTTALELAGESREATSEDEDDGRHLKDVLGPGYTGRLESEPEPRPPKPPSPFNAPGTVPAWRRWAAEQAAARRRAREAAQPGREPPPLEARRPTSSPAHARPPVRRGEDGPWVATDTAEHQSPPGAADLAGPSADTAPSSPATEASSSGLAAPASSSGLAAPASSSGLAAAASSSDLAHGVATTAAMAAPRLGAASPLLWMGIGGVLALVLGGIVVMKRPELLAPAPQGPEPTIQQPSPAELPMPSEAAAVPTSNATSTSTATTSTSRANAPRIVEAPPVPDPSRTGPDEDTRLAAAIAEGKLRALDLLVVLPPRAQYEVSWEAAANHCKTRRVAGVRGWRLATAHELKSIRRARMLREGVYWSGTLADRELDTILVVDTSRRRMVALSKVESATPVCVRPR
jgi:hypothetical protein